MKIITTLLFLLTLTGFLEAQLVVKEPYNFVGINEPNPTSVLHIQSRGSTEPAIVVHNTLGNEIFRVKEGGTNHGNFFVKDKDGNIKIQFTSTGKFYVNNGNKIGFWTNNLRIQRV